MTQTIRGALTVSGSSRTSLSAPWRRAGGQVFLPAFLILWCCSAALAANSDCLMCHSEPDMFEDYGERAGSLVVSDRTLAGSVHEGFQCVDCHADLAGVEDFPHAERLAPANCASCHDDAVGVFTESWHGQVAAQRGRDPLSPTCASCHGSHEIRPASDTASLVHPGNLPHTCAACHTQLAEGIGTGIRRLDAYSRYVKGVHAERIGQGILSSATCNDCHGYHDLRKASDPLSRVYKYNIPRTCGSCHTEVLAQYERGIHGQALKAGVTSSPTCADCHGEHEILAHSGADSPVHAANLTDQGCARCHNNERLVAKYGLKGGRISSYQDSYHGMAVRRGSTKAASCVSCHDAHDILPESDPASSIAPGRIIATCQKCHPRANAAFASSYSHEAILGEPHSIKGVIERIYIPLIVLIVGGMAVHNGLIILHYVRKRKAQEEIGITHDRLSPTMVFQHAAFGVSFIILVITGFALRFPDAWWSHALSTLGFSEAWRSNVHRVAGCIMIGVSLHHVLFVAFSRRGRTEFWHMIPRLLDLRQARENIRYYLGGAQTKPDFDRYDYTEKAEYWALVWGTAVMVITGFVLWFPEIFTKWLPGWIVIASETIHYYEAWLATLAIVVWHFFFVIFHPDEYPMNLTWMRGRISDHHLKEKHPAWYRRILTERHAQEDAHGDEPSEAADKDSGETV